jgi:GT2 family glycosyltransferase
MKPTLLVGGSPRSSADHLPLETSRAAHRAHGFREVVLQEPLHDLADGWRTLRDLRAFMTPNSVLTIRFDPGKLSPADVDSLIRITGYQSFARRLAPGAATVRARRRPLEPTEFSCSVVVPCKNEVGNVDDVVRRLPSIGTHTELIFVDGTSTDGTQARIRKLIAGNPEKDIKLLEQRHGGGKAAAVRMGFDAASSEVLMILDADMTVAPEDLDRFFIALSEGAGDVANGNRLAYPMESGAMRHANYLGNRAFARLFSWLLCSRVGDTLCGTKAIFRRDWPEILAVRPLFGGHDLWGDFDLLLGSAHVGLRIVDVPIVYRARIAGESKMQVFRHGISMLRSSLAGFRALKVAAWRRRKSRADALIER